MDRAELARLYTTGEFADCTFFSEEGQGFKAHRFILNQYPRLKALIDKNNHIHLAESTKATKRLLHWVYGMETWKADHVQPTREGVGKELTEIMGLSDVAQKYGIAKLGDSAYNAVGKILSNITSAEVGLYVIRDLTEQNTGTGALQRTIIDRVLSLLSRDVAAAADPIKKRKRESSVYEFKEDEEDNNAGSSPKTVATRPDRIKKPTAKVQQVAQVARKSAPGTADALDALKKRRSSIKVYCVCEKPEDPFLVQCEGCQDWFHPGCVGKGKYAESSYKSARKIAHAGDEKMYREKALKFTCTGCDNAVAK